MQVSETAIKVLFKYPTPPPISSSFQKTHQSKKVKVQNMVVWCLILCLLMPKGEAKPALYVFGDSMYDDGMTLYNGVKGAGAQYWPYGETYFKKPAGRYSDGLLIPDFIAQFAGLPLTQPYLLPGLSSYTNGVNFASAGACVLVKTRPNTINIKMQVDYYVQMVQKLKQQVGEANAKKVVSEAVYLFNIGGNDYVEFVKRHLNTQYSDSERNSYMNKVIGNLLNHIKTIYNQGGRKFAFQNIGPLGCMPSMKFTLGFTGTCAQQPLKLAQMHNSLFLYTVKKLQYQLPGFKYTVYDFYTSLYRRVLYGNKYGFSNTQTACCGSGAFNGDFTCQKKGTKFTVCSNPNSYLWFDAGHPTQKADKQFALEFWTASSNLVAPYNLRTFFSIN